jgi:hypothetical protein
MPKPGVHFPQKFITVVLSNGATFQMSTIVSMKQPIFLEKVCGPRSDVVYLLVCGEAVGDSSVYRLCWLGLIRSTLRLQRRSCQNFPLRGQKTPSVVHRQKLLAGPNEPPRMDRQGCPDDQGTVSCC